MKTKTILGCCISGLLAFTGCAQPPATPNTAAARAFVQSFYDWYAPFARRSSKTPAWITAVKERNSSFSRDLSTALQEDADAQTKAQGEIVGLDFDPFLYAQDSGPKYTVGSITQKDGNFSVAVSATSNQRSHKPALTAQVVCDRQHCQFVDFFYPENTSLRKVLGELKASRSKQ